MTSFPGYLPSEASPRTNYNTYSSIDPRAASSDFLHKDVSYIFCTSLQVSIQVLN